jgi:hypothetical protein
MLISESVVALIIKESWAQFLTPPFDIILVGDDVYHDEDGDNHK